MDRKFEQTNAELNKLLVILGFALRTIADKGHLLAFHAAKQNHFRKTLRQKGLTTCECHVLNISNTKKFFKRLYRFCVRVKRNPFHSICFPYIITIDTVEVAAVGGFKGDML